MEQKRLKAVASGVLLGCADCYVLDDGQRVVSQAGILRILRGSDRREKSDLGPYLERLPNEFKYLTTAAKVEFILPNGGVAVGRTVEQLADIAMAYVQMGATGDLHPSQAHLAKNAVRVVRASNKIGLVALVDEATGYQDKRPKDELGLRIERYLNEQAAPHQVLWGPDVVSAICGAYSHKYEKGRLPQWLSSPIHRLYGLILTDEIVAELKRRNPNPRFGRNHHQFLTEEIRPYVAAQVQVVKVIAKTSRGRADFWNRCAWYFKQVPMQLPLAA